MGSGGSKKHETYTTAPTTPPVPVLGEPAAETVNFLPAEDMPPDAAVDFAGTAGTGTQPVSESTPPPPGAEPDDSSPVPPDAVDEEDGTATTARADPRGDVVTPIPQTPPEGRAAGVPVLVGGTDLADATATLISYTSPDGGGPREVLLATLTEEAEAKLTDALALDAEHLVAVQVQEEINGRLPADEHKQLHELVAKTAKSVNHKLKHALPIPPHTQQYLATAQAAVQEVLDDPNTTADEQTMAAHYQAHLDAIAARVADPAAQPYEEGGKVPHVHPYLHTGVATITKLVPAPQEEPGPGLLAATLRDASRIQAHIDPATGAATWDGTSRSPADGKEYAIDLGEGWQAVYRPYSANDPAEHEYSLRGQLEVHAPQGAGHGHQLVRRLGELNLVNRAMTHAEGEWTYLAANIDAQRLGEHPAVKTALTHAGELEELQLQELYHTHAHQAVGLDDQQLAALAKEWQIEAAAACLPKKVRMVREAVATATGHADGATLAASPGYDPAPRASGGWLTWSRFDVGNQHSAVEAAWQGRSLVHHVTGANLTDLLATGVLASTERRAVMGIPAGKGMSESSDKYSGGANAVFTRVRASSSVGKGPRLVWDDPVRLLDNTGVYGYDGDHFGALNPKGNHSVQGMTTDPVKMAHFSAKNNEVMFRHGLDLLGAQAPSRILCHDSAQRTEVLALLAKKGITHLNGQPVDQIVQ
ncbi:hypothetical protein NI17_009980 [Thermobifida halotolerans]|uniref:Uncharacterized protein n=2 Tax=Thermobifida halotolerans TaxID=483545 RepID=A0A399FXG2_9ACTN|nr:hypothetical protein NI17_009980 [Thermobifida halotolerans]